MIKSFLLISGVCLALQAHFKDSGAGRLDMRPPFQGWSHGFLATTKGEEKFVRVSTTGTTDPVGRWLVRKQDIADVMHDAKEIQKRLSLPNTPTHITDVTVPSNTELYLGRIRSNFEGGEGTMQYLVPSQTDSRWFSGTRELK